MKKLLSLSLFLIPLLLPAQQVAKNLTASNGVFIGFYEYKPVDYNANPTTKYPVIIFLHGIGERGDGVTNLPLVLANGIPKNINAGHTMRFFWNGKWETFLVLSPQLSTAYGNWPDFYVSEMINYAKQNLRIDPDRIFLTGLSLGGGGVWSFSSSSFNNAKELAAIAPVCGTCTMYSACNIANANLPVWAFHAQDDGTVGVGCTTSSIQSINNCNPAVKPLMSIYPSGGHGIWGRSYDTEYNYHDPNMYEWFLGQNKSLPVNILPVANAGNDFTISSVVGTASLNGSGSTDADGNLVRYSWKQISGPVAGNILSPITTNGLTSVSGLTTPGTYQYELKVVDNRAGLASDLVTITVSSSISGGNIAPVARTKADYTITLPTNSATLAGSDSYDSDGSIVSVNWSKISGPAQFTISNIAAVNTTATDLVQGTYNFKLTVTDNYGATGSDTIAITVNSSVAPPPPTNQAPIANAGADIVLTLPANNATLNGWASYDTDGSITSYSWSKTSGPSSYSIANPGGGSTALTGLVQGTYTFSLTVTDNAGATSVDNINVTVNPGTSQNPPASLAPFARTGPNTIITLPTNSTTVSGYNSYDPDGYIVSFSWSKISGPQQFNISNSTAGSTSITNLAQGSYLFRLLVTDNSGATGDDTIMVTVNPGPSSIPVSMAPLAKAGPNFSITLPANSINLNGYNSYDPDGYITSFNWSKINGPAQYNIANPSSGSTTVTNLAQGSYLFRLMVTDNTGIMADDTLMVIVNPGSAPIIPITTPPIARAGADNALTLPSNTATLRGYDSYDPDGYITSFAWSKISGPQQYNIYNPSDGMTSVTNLVQGAYLFRLLVTDNAGASSADTVLLTVNSTTGLSNPSTGGSANSTVAKTVGEGSGYADKITAYPNPATSNITLRYSSDTSGQSKMIIYDVTGKAVRQVQFYKGSSTYEIPVSLTDFKTGIYFVEIVTGNRKKLVTKFIRQ